MEEERISFRNLKNIGFGVDDASAEESEIVCVQKANWDPREYSGFSFQNITNLEIDGLTFTGCSYFIEESNNSYFSHVSAGLYMRGIINLTLNQITVQNSTGYGLYLSQIYGTSSIRDSIFQCNNARDSITDGGNVKLIYQTPQTLISSDSILTIERSKFLHGKSFRFASGLLIMLFCSGVKIRIIDAELNGNQAKPPSDSNCAMQPSFGGNLGFLLHDYDSSGSKCTAESNSTELTILNSTISSGQACYGGGMFAKFTSSNKTDKEESANFSIINSVFSENRAWTSGAAIFMQMNSQVEYKI